MKDQIAIKWLDLPLLPPVEGKSVQPGLAGALSGAYEDYLLVAGGANFEDAMPWRGGTKSYHDEIFLYHRSLINNNKWKQAGEKLPFALAYTACLSLKEGIISIGGETIEGPVKDVFRFTIEKGCVRTENLPPLPVALTAPSAASSGRIVYVAGGMDIKGAVDSFFSLDLDHPAAGWQELPHMPVALSHMVAAFQNDGNENCLYIVGGRNKTSDIHSFFSEIWKFLPSEKKWIREGEIMADGKPIPLAAGTGLPAGENLILIFGGDPGIFFNMTERLNNSIAAAGDSLKQLLLQEKDSLLTNHPGFTRDILVYHTVTRSWNKAGSLPSSIPVTTTAFFWNGKIIIPSGEIRPGIRTPVVLAAEIKSLPLASANG